MKKNRKGQKIKYLMEGMEKPHYQLFFISICIAVVGILMIMSATYAKSGMYYAGRQALFVLIGIGVVALGTRFSMSKILYRCAKGFYVAAVFLLLALKTPLGVSSHGATRWLRFPLLQIQPVEIMKLAVIIMLAVCIYQKYKSAKSIKLTVYSWMIGGVAGCLTLWISSDLSSALVIIVITFGLTFVFYRTNKFQIVCLCLVIAVAGAYVFYVKHNLPDVNQIGEYSYRIGRIAAWLYPERYPDLSYQTQTSLYAIGSGGMWGVGLGKMRISVPEGQTDFIFALLTHQTGIWGGIGLLFCYAYLFYQIFRIAINASSLYETVLTTGILVHIAAQVCINIGVCLSLLPNTGLPLVLMSYGGSSILTSFLEIAICVSVSKKAVRRQCERKLKKENI